MNRDSHQQTLFDPVRLARRDGPVTSKAAAEEIVGALGELQQWTIACVKESPGLTQRELGLRWCPTDPRRIGRRLNECERAGRLRRGPARACSVSGRMAETWYPVEGE